MLHHYADDGRVLTPPKELEPQLKGSFPAFSKTLGHIRFFYMADEIWDGKSSLVFTAGGEQLAAITLGDGIFHVHIADKDFIIADETILEIVLEALKKTVSSNRRRPSAQLTINLNDPNQFPCGRRCDLCLGSKKSDKSNFSKNENFGYMNWVCYHNCVPDIKVERWDGVYTCPGCVETRKTKDCKYYPCPTEKGYADCLECGEYHSCDIYSDSHYPGQCNLGLTAEEVTNLVIPYCNKERLDFFATQRQRRCSHNHDIAIVDR